MQLNSNGNFIAVSNFGSASTSAQNVYDVMRAVTINNRDEVFAAGAFSQTADVDPTSATQFVTSAGMGDMLLLKLKSCNFDYAKDTVVACGSYTLPSGAVATQSGFYQDTALSAQGCDSIVDVTLAILPALNTFILQNVNGLAAHATGSGFSYIWLDCATNQPIAGANQQVYVPTTNGSYAVIISNLHCTDTTACFTVNNVNLEENNLAKNTLLYPNPTSGLLQIDSPQLWLYVEVTDLTGRTLIAQKGSSETLDLSALPSGVYVVKLLFENGVVMQKVVKE